jgi:type IV pilus biogenesis protein CpaD/CtpE
MPALSLSIRLRLGTLVLLASVLPMAVQAPAPAGGTGTSAHPAAWLRAQVGVAEPSPSQEQEAARAAFDAALNRAQAAETRTLHDFLSDFLSAHARLTGAEVPATNGRSTRALVAEVRHRLSEAGLTVRSLMRMSTSPAGPLAPARWAAASLLAPTVERTSGAPAYADAPSRGRVSAPALGAAAAARAGSSLARATLFRVLFSGRRLGP